MMFPRIFKIFLAATVVVLIGFGMFTLNHFGYTDDGCFASLSQQTHCPRGDTAAFMKMHLDAFRNIDMQNQNDLLARVFLTVIAMTLGTFVLLKDELIPEADIKWILYQKRFDRAPIPIRQKLMGWKSLHENSPN